MRGSSLFRKIIGVDLLPGESPAALQEPFVAYVLLYEGNVRERGVARLREILALIERERVEALAVDNIYELAPSISELQSVMSSLTHPPRLVQVTMIGERAYPLASIAASLGLAGSKLSPQQAAEVAARLCYMGIGSELQLFESDETRVVISKGRTPIQGGMSVERYRRSIESRLLKKTREVQELLRERGLDYDLFITKTAYGVERSVFVIYAPRERIYGIVRPIKDHDIQISIEPVARRDPFFVPLTSHVQRQRKSSEYLIVGVDPGVSTGVAALTLDGRLKLLISGKELGRGQVARTLLDVGTPLVICTDVSPPPGYVKRLAAMLSAVLIYPPHPLSIEDKRHLVSEFSTSAEHCVKVRDSHQRDALAAALFAMRHFQPKFSEAKEKVERLGLSIPLDEVLALVVKGVPIWEAIRQVSKDYLIPTQRPSPPVTPQAATQPIELAREKVDELYKRVRELEEEKKMILSRLKELETQLERLLQIQSFEVRRDREVEALRSRLDNLLRDYNLIQQQVEDLKKEKETLLTFLMKAAVGELVLAPRFSSPHTMSEHACTGGVVVFGAVSPSDLTLVREKVRKLALRAVISEQRLPEQLIEALACDDVVAFSPDEVKPLAVIGDVYILDKKYLEYQIECKLKSLDNRTRRLMKDFVKNIIEGYKTERTKALIQTEKS
ncbi:MAG: DUF460 domain-containing protein [Thermofilaceae archaeon]